MSKSKILFRASSVGALMTNSRSKKDANFEKWGLSKTALSYIEKEFLRNKYGYDEPLVSKELLKGIMCEEDSIGLISKHIPSASFRKINKERKTNDFFSGKCDLETLVSIDDTIEEIKTPWSIKTFFEVKEPPKNYYTQAQVYCELWGASKARLIYALVPTPEELILEEEKRYFFKFGCDDQNPEFVRICKQIRKNHDLSKVPEEMRIKVFQIEKDEEYLSELKQRVLLARTFYKSLSLVPESQSIRSLIQKNCTY